jgi:hypothetical protein
MNISNTQVPYSQPSVETMVGNTKQEYPKPSVPPEIEDPTKVVQTQQEVEQKKVEDKPNGTGIPRDLDVANKNIYNPDTEKIRNDVKESNIKASEQQLQYKDREEASQDLNKLQDIIKKQNGYETYAQNMGMLM